MTNTTQSHDINFFKEQYPKVLKEMALKADLEHGGMKHLTTVNESMWLIECEESEVAENPFVLYYHESGNLYGITGFSDQPSFLEACKSLLLNVWGIQFTE